MLIFSSQLLLQRIRETTVTWLKLLLLLSPEIISHCRVTTWLPFRNITRVKLVWLNQRNQRTVINHLPFVLFLPCPKAEVICHLLEGAVADKNLVLVWSILKLDLCLFLSIYIVPEVKRSYKIASTFPKWFSASLGHSVRESKPLK